MSTTSNKDPRTNSARMDSHGGIDLAPEGTDFKEIVRYLSKDLDLKSELALAVVPVLLQNLITLDKKQQDYGPHNLTKFGVGGVIVRMNDKMERIINLDRRRKENEAFAFNEPISDSFLDIANYGFIAYVMERGLWPDKKTVLSAFGQ